MKDNHKLCSPAETRPESGLLWQHPDYFRSRSAMSLSVTCGFGLLNQNRSSRQISRNPNCAGASYEHDRTPFLAEYFDMKEFGKSVGNSGSRLLLLLIGLGGGFCPVALEATTTNVSVGDNVFTPSSMTINASDTVHWTWVGVSLHSSTANGTPAMWDSGIVGNGSGFSFTFNSAGSFPYHCNVHALQTGTVTVQAANQPPRVGFTVPANNSTFSAPWTGTLQATNSDPDGTVVRVQFLAGATSLGTITNPAATATLRVTNIAAGNYTLTAKATDNQGTVTTSAGMTIHVVTPAPIILSSPQRVLPSTFQFNYTTTTNLKYVIERSGGLAGFTPLATNNASGSTASFTDNTATGALEYYRIKLQPNP
jgi:plastocyanin